MQNVISVDNMRKSDKYTIKNITSSKELMLRAGRAVYNSVNWQGRVGIVCGMGNNGGDGYALAIELAKSNIECELVLARDKFSQVGSYYFNQCREMNIPYKIYNENISLDSYDIIVDCIFGTGFKGDVSGVEKNIIEKINLSRAYKVSVDMNSGLNGDNGLTNLCVKSDLTVSIGTLKAGHILNMAKDEIGKLCNCDIGIKPIEAPYKLIEREDIKNILKKRKSYTHKGNYGYVALIGGSKEYSGAVKLSNLSASCVRSGAGVVRLCVPRSISNSVMPYLLESTLFELKDKKGSIAFDKREIEKVIFGTNVIAFGMGLGQRGQNKRVLTYILKSYDKTLIIDADGLNTLSKMDADLLKNAKCKIVLTPHLKEFERLCGFSIAQINENPIKYAKEYARSNNVILLLKGSATIITDGQDVYLTNTGCAGMASGGSGDVLSGVLAGLCASNDAPLMENVAAGAYVNGYSAQISSKEMCDIAMCAQDTAKNVGRAISLILNNE